MIRHFLYVLLTFVVLSLGLTPALIIYWLNEAPPIRYSTRRIITPEVPPGGILKILVSAEVTQKCTATVKRSLVDSSGYVFAQEPATRPTFTNYTVEIPVPLGASAGPALYRARVEWDCNPLQKFFPYVVLQPEMEFRILPAAGQMQLPRQQGIYAPLERKSELAVRSP